LAVVLIPGVELMVKLIWLLPLVGCRTSQIHFATEYCKKRQIQSRFLCLECMVVLSD